MSISMLVLSNEEQSMDYEAGVPSFLLVKTETYPLDVPCSRQNILLQKVHYCFRESLSERLFAAFIDLFIAIQGRDGAKFALRMFSGTKSKLTEEHR